MSIGIDGLLSYVPGRLDQVTKDSLVGFWNMVRACEEIGLTTWEELEPIERAVTECLDQDPPDLARAVSLTYKAHILIAGLEDL